MTRRGVLRLVPRMRTVLLVLAAAAVLAVVAYFAPRSGLLLPFVGLYTRIAPSRVLENPQRRAIYEYLRRNPGATPGDLRREMHLHYTTCLHHIRKLAEFGYVRVARIGAAVRCFENHGGFGATETRLVAAARAETTRSLLRIVLRNPDVTPAEVARSLGIARSSTKYQVDRLVAWGLLEARPDGAHVRLRVVPGAVDALVGLLSREGARSVPTPS